MTATRYCAWRYALLLVAAVAVGNSGAAHCPEGTDTTFEVLTGFVLTLPDAILHTKQGVLRLDRCIDICRRMDGCEAVNFEIGLCVLFAKSDQGKCEPTNDSSTACRVSQNKKERHSSTYLGRRSMICLCNWCSVNELIQNGRGRYKGKFLCH